MDLENARIRYHLEGEGPDVVFLHGFSLDMRSWDPQIEALTKRFRVLRYDLRGFGQSSLPSGAYDHCKDLAALIERFGLVRPVLVGLSLGANIALRFALEKPDMICGCLLASSGLPGHEWREERPPDAARAYAAHHGIEAGKVFWLGHPLFESLSDHPAAAAATRSMVEDYSGWHWSHEDLQQAIPVIDRLEAISVPVRIVSGARDVAGYREIAAVLADRIPGSTLAIAPRAGHMINLEAPDWFNGELVAFAEEIAKAGVPKEGAA